MMRSTLLWLSKRQSIFNFVRSNRLAKKFASRFVAGETIETGVAAALELKAKGISVSLDLLGESVHQPSEAEAARDAYVAILRAMGGAGLEADASLKPTALGLASARDLYRVFDLQEGPQALSDVLAEILTDRRPRGRQLP